MSNLAGALWRRGELAEASRLLEGVVRRKRLTLGSDHPDLATDAARYAEMLHAGGRSAEAETIFVKALAVHRRAHPRGHKATARTLLGLARLRLDRGDTAVAIGMIREAIAIERRTLPATHRRIADAERLLAGTRPR